MYLEKLYKITKRIPAEAGYYNYDKFPIGAIVYLDKLYPWKYCILCDEEGNEVLDEDGEAIYLDWHPEYGESPIWEDKLEFYKNIMFPDGEEYSENANIAPRYISTTVDELLTTLSEFPGDTVVCLDLNGSTTKKYGKDNITTILKSKQASLIAINNNVTIIPDDSTIDDLLNSIESTDSITINFSKNDKRTT